MAKYEVVFTYTNDRKLLPRWQIIDVENNAEIVPGCENLGTMRLAELKKERLEACQRIEARLNKDKEND